jgi:DNA polymerase V
MKPVPARDKPPPQVGPQLSSGFPSPANDYEEPELDLHDLVVENPLATYFMRSDTDALEGAGVRQGDLLVVDRSLNLKDQQLVIVVLDDVLTLKRYRKAIDQPATLEDDNGSQPMASDCLWGVVTYCVRKL